MLNVESSEKSERTHSCQMSANAAAVTTRGRLKSKETVKMLAAEALANEPCAMGATCRSKHTVQSEYRT